MDLFSVNYGDKQVANLTAIVLDIIAQEGYNQSWFSPQSIDLLFNTSWETLLSNRRISEPAFSILIFVYSVLILVGTCGNCLVIVAVIRQPAMRTLRNAFIINLAFSDLLLCLCAIPLTLMEMLTIKWPLGNSVISCKIAGGLPAVTIFVSTISITVISLDRYQLIVYPAQDYLKKIGALLGLLVVWTVSFLLATPLFIFRTLDHHRLGGPPIESANYCYEKWPINHGRALYSLATIVIQYVAPIVTVSIAHARICRKLRLRHSMLLSVCQDSRKQALEKRRLRKLNVLLMAIAFIFAVCWMPLNVFNLAMDLYAPASDDQDQLVMVMYAVCHMLGMSSALANPLLYGYLNENFRQEFRDIAKWLCPCLPTIGTSQDGQGRQQHVIRKAITLSPSLATNNTVPLALPSTQQQVTCEVTIDGPTNVKQTAL